MIISKQKQFFKDDQRSEVNSTRLARIFFMVGEFKLGLETLIKANQLVQAVHFAVCLSELGFLLTR